ncbi:lipopolysaccharide biosynthesis protein [Deinococcus sp. Leaf326]|uniref:lipopolysaccharide biosynthesis protein n=1 Tax=Deinococcus sp. Leaf326 TaxID=1736338 RepID=UPI0006F7AB79|nr:lipopolysaccharide biosynthesis protein [Deinococcus sp. Leaf326]KQQ97823.1 hypothetical protein ASF71_14470 [Deinococcus sp. Leaf326]
MTPPGIPTSPLRAAVLWTLGGNLVFAATQWSMLVVLARLGDPADVGRYTLGLAVTTPVFLLLSLQLRGAQATEPPDSPYRFGHYFTLRTLLAGLALALCAGWVLLSGAGEGQPTAGLAAVTGWLALAKLFDGLSDVCYGHLQATGRLAQVSRSLMLRGVLSALGLAGAFALTRDVGWAAAAVAGGYLGGLLLYDLPRTRAGTGHWWRPEWPRLRSLARLTWPLGVAVGLIALNASLPRYFLGREAGLGAVGLYSALSYVTVAGSMVVTALGQAATTPLARLAAQGDAAGFRALLGRLLLLGTALGGAGVLGALLLGRPVLELLYGPAYGRDVPLFALLMLGAAPGYVASFAGFGMTALREFGAQVPLFLGTTATLALACALLIPEGGLAGAAWATVIGGAAQLLGSLWIVRRALRRGPPPAQTPAAPPHPPSRTVETARD